MRQGPNGRRGRGRPHPGGGNGQGNGQGGNSSRRSNTSLRNQSFDSNGPNVRVRGNAWQVHEKYKSFAQDAAAAGDRVAAENYLQHAEHYYRIIEAINEANAAEQQARGYGQQPDTRNYYPQPNGASGEGQVEIRGNVPFTTGNTTQPIVHDQNAAPPAASSPFFSVEAEETEEGDPQVPATATGRR